MRAWMHQLNPSKFLFLTPEGEDVPTSIENLFRYAFATKDGLVGGWYMTQFFNDAQSDDGFGHATTEPNGV